MCTSCECCKLRDEDLYRNLDDEEKHFLMFMMGDFRDAMIIPEELLRRFKGEIPGEIQLETQKGDSHPIVVAKNQEKLVFTFGWRQFVESYDLHMGDSVMLKYNGNSQFNVIIFDNLGREKAISVVLDPYITQVQERRRNAHEIGSAKNMDAPCGRCKGYLEYYYMNLDDEKKNMLMLMMGDFQHEMIIPEEFVKRFKGEIPGEITLETQNRRSYIIAVAKHQKRLVLTAGWGKFVQTFGLQMSDTIVCRYNGNSKFSVIIFDKLGCENALSVVADPFDLDPVQERHTNATEAVNRSNIHPQSAEVKLPVESMNTSQSLPRPMEMQPSTRRVDGPLMESPPTKRQRLLQTEKSCQGNMAPIKYFYAEASEESFSSEDGYGAPDVPDSNCNLGKKSQLFSFQKEQLKDGYVTTQKAKLTSAQQKQVKAKVQSLLLSEIPIVVAVMTKSNVDSGCSLNFPSLYVKKYLGGDPNMYLQVLGQKYAVRFGEADHDKRIKSGWKKFVQDNNLKIGDICLFELLSSNQRRRTMEVYIIPANHGN